MTGVPLSLVYSGGGGVCERGEKLPNSGSPPLPSLGLLYLLHIFFSQLLRQGQFDPDFLWRMNRSATVRCFIEPYCFKQDIWRQILMKKYDKEILLKARTEYKFSYHGLICALEIFRQSLKI